MPRHLEEFKDELEESHSNFPQTRISKNSLENMRYSQVLNDFRRNFSPENPDM